MNISPVSRKVAEKQRNEEVAWEKLAVKGGNHLLLDMEEPKWENWGQDRESDWFKIGWWQLTL